MINPSAIRVSGDIDVTPNALGKRVTSSAACDSNANALICLHLYDRGEEGGTASGVTGRTDRSWPFQSHEKTPCYLTTYGKAALQQSLVI
jgi:hypothetical protein